MSYCTPCPPCDTNFPLLCEPLETTANGKRLVVEDSAACQKTIQTPISQQVLKTDGIGNLTWTNGGNNTVLGKDSTGKVEFVTSVNNILQSGPVNLGSQPLTTTGSISTGGITATGNVGVSGTPGTKTTALINYQGDQAIVTPDISDWETSIRVTASTQGTTPSEVAVFTGNAERLRVKNNGNVGVGTSAPTAKFVVNGPASSDNQPEIKVTGNVGSIDIHNSISSGAWNNIVQAGDKGIIFYDATESTGNFVIAPWRSSSLAMTGIRMEGSTGDIGIHTSNPARPLHVTGIVRLSGLQTYANNAAAITGGLVADDVYKTATGELRIVV